MIRIYVKTTGCKVNQRDSERLRDALSDLPVAFVARKDEADLVVVNACTVTRAADRDGRAAVLQALRRPGVPVILGGCMATRLKTLPARDEPPLPLGVTIVAGTSDRKLLVETVRQQVLQCLARLPAESFDLGRPAPRRSRSRPVITVQDGCNHRCSYCIVPLVRGPCTSTEVAEVLRDAALLDAEGVAEVVLTGIDLGAWGSDLDPHQAFPDLLDALIAAGTRMRFRLSSIEPHGLTPRLLERATGHPDVCRHLHVPLQSGSDRILASMRRPHRADDVITRLGALAACKEPFGLGLDVICGFPGETDQDFADTLAVLEALPVTYLHVFPFSARPGTPAAEMGPSVPHGVKMARCEALRHWAQIRKVEHAAALIGHDVEVVDVRRVRQEPDWIECLASDYSVVHRVAGRGLRTGRFRVRITGHRGPVALACEVA